MPALSLVVCLHNERDLLERLLRNSEGCYDDLVVVHDGPDVGGTRALVESYRGRFFERPREYQQEPHWPFAWGEAKCDWILRLDADEFPSEEMKVWLKGFRKQPEPPIEISGFTCIWPIWNGKRAISKRWPNSRNFLFNKQRVRFFGMAEQTPVPDRAWHELPLIIEHQPQRKSHSFSEIFFRRQNRRWRERIASSLMGRPLDLPGWRWESDAWPIYWEEIRRAPLRTALYRVTIESLRILKRQWKTEGRVFLGAAIGAPFHHAFICLRVIRLKWAYRFRKRL